MGMAENHFLTAGVGGVVQRKVSGILFDPCVENHLQ
jgi:hypothetical protein